MNSVPGVPGSSPGQALDPVTRAHPAYRGARHLLVRRARFFGLIALIVLLGACGQAHVVQREPGNDARNGSAPPRTPPATRRAGSGEVEVVHGDTLYGIAFRNGMDFRELAALNGIEAPYTIRVGQVLKLRGGHTPASNGPVVQTPAHPVHVVPQPAAPVVSTSPTSHIDEPAPAASRAPSAAILPAEVSSAGGISWRWPARGTLLDRFMAGDATRQGLDIGGDPGEPVVAASDGVVVYSGSGLVGYGELIIIKHSDEWLSAYGHNRKRLVQEGQRVRAGQPIAEMGSTGANRNELHFEIRRNGKPVDPQQYLPAR
jgi:lipoprotein NlpD